MLRLLFGLGTQQRLMVRVDPFVEHEVGHWAISREEGKFFPLFGVLPAMGDFRYFGWIGMVARGLLCQDFPFSIVDDDVRIFDFGEFPGEFDGFELAEMD
jgi:hypothetical protein